MGADAARGPAPEGAGHWVSVTLATMSAEQEASSPSVPRGWLVLSVGDDRQHAGNTGYADDLATTYRWDSTVPHHLDLRAGDLIAIWDKQRLLGMSVIDSIKQSEGIKLRLTCPKCGKAGIKRRKSLNPAYRCHECSAQFDTPTSREEQVTTWATDHADAWTDLEGRLTGAQLRALCESPKSQLSMRPLRVHDFLDAISQEPEGAGAARLARSWLNTRPGGAGPDAPPPEGGHRNATVRVRRGQGAFRARLLAAHGESCAITGPCPEAALEAAHLYSYAEQGEHHQHGGLLMRRDLHRLFDLGLIAVRAKSWTIDVDPSLMAFPDYAALHGHEIKVGLTSGHQRWLRLHWDLHR